MKRKWAKYLLWAIASPFILALLLVVSLYIPPIQHALCRKAAEYASAKSGMQITIGRIGLKFPLRLSIGDALVVSRRDTILQASDLCLIVKPIPLLKGRFEVDHVSLCNTSLYTRDIIKGVCLRGRIGNAMLKTRVDFGKHVAMIDMASVENSNMNIALVTDTTKKDTTPPAPWNISVKKLKIHRVAFSYRGLPKDHLYCSAYLENAGASNVRLSIKEPWYAIQHMHINGGKIRYDNGNGKWKAHELSTSHLLVRNIQMNIESFYMCRKVMKATVRNVSFYDRSGFTVTHLQAYLHTDNNTIYVPGLFMRTPYSEVRISGSCPWNIMQIKRQYNNAQVSMDAYIGKGDVLLWTKTLPSVLIHKYPSAPLVIHTAVKGNMQSVRISRLEARLSGAFSMNGSGYLLSLADQKRRSGKIDLKMQMGRLDFITEMMGLNNGRVAIPSGLALGMNIVIKGSNYSGRAILNDKKGSLVAQGSFNTKKKSYKASVEAHQFQLHRFLPKDDMYLLTADAQIEGAGFDIKSNSTRAKTKMSVGYLEYKTHKFTNIHFDASLQKGIVHAQFDSDNQLLKMSANGSCTVNLHYLRGNVDMNVDKVDLYKLGMLSSPIKRDFAFVLKGCVDKDSVAGHLTTGDFKLNFNSGEGLPLFLSRFDRFTNTLMHQLKVRALDHAALRRALPKVTLYCQTGINNTFADYLALQGIRFSNMTIGISTSPLQGLDCHAKILGLKKDSTQIDTISLVGVQDTSHIEIHGRAINNKSNPMGAFRIALNGEINSVDGNLLAEYFDKSNNTGLRLGVRFTPDEKKGGILLNIIPEKPIIAFRQFHFENNNNQISLLPNGGVLANVDLVDNENMSFRIHSVDNDSTSLRNLDVAISQVKLDELARLLPYSPPLSGTLSLDANYVQTDEKKMSLSIEGNIDKLCYDQKMIGNMTLGATWLPGEKGRQYVNAYISQDGKKVLLADGDLNPKGGGKDTLDVNARFDHFPLKVANVFVPNQMVSFEGDIDGNMHLEGSATKPVINGSLKMDSVMLTYNQAGTHYRFDSRPLQIVNNKLLFDKYAIYTTDNNPFAIDGYVSFENLYRPIANLNMQAKNYVLISAPRTYGCLLYGKLIVDFNSTLKGPLNNLVMRGNMNVKKKTNITYVLDNTPLSIEDRLSDLVTFTNFSNTANEYDSVRSNVSLGGFDMRMDLHIDPSVQLKADLSADRSSQVALEGGGDLYFRYSPQGDLTLNGRYNLAGSSTIRYSMPVVPLKNFNITQGSYIDWNGDPYNPRINFDAIEQVTASVTMDDGTSQAVNFNVGLSMKDRLNKPTLLFTLSAPDNANVQNQLSIMSAEEQNKQAIILLTTGIYLESGSKTNKINMGTAALNSVLSSQINQLVGNIKNGSLSMGLENHDDAETGGTVTDYSFRYSQRLFNNRIRVVVGGKISSAKNTSSGIESFIDNISLEYRLDDTGSRYVQLFHNKNYESILDGEITETGVGLLFHKRVDKFGELFIFRKKKEK